MATSSQRESPLAPGHRLDGYELLWPIGEGGMASVWVARLTRKHGFEKLVAIKTILPKFAEDEQFQKMFLDEARIASRIDHANVAHIHDLGEKDDVLYLVMEYVDGDALTRLRKILIKRAMQFPVGIALRVMGDVCSGLHAAHELKSSDGKPLGVVHRDVSPQNILITTDGVSKVIDFGVAKAAGRLTEETHTGYVKGKVQYMAPEQALGKNVDRRADVWAVGAVLYHLIANRPPFEADNQLALLNLLQRARPPAPLPPTIPVLVVDIIKKALTHNPMQRFQTALEMRSAIEKTGLAASQEEVSAFVAEYLGELASHRRAAISAAIQNADALRARESAPMMASMAGGGSTQRIDPKNLPYLPPPPDHTGAGHSSGAFPAGRVPPASDTRIGPPTPQAFPIAPMASAVLHGPRPTSDPRMMTMPLAASFAATPTRPSLPYQMVQTRATEPLPSVEALEAALNENTNGSLGLASISSSINTHRPKSTQWLVVGIASFVLVALAVGVGLGVRGRIVGGGKKFDPQFSPLPPSSEGSLPAISTAVTAPKAPTPPDEPTTSATPTPTPEPPSDPPTTTTGVPVGLEAGATPHSGSTVRDPVPVKPVPVPVGSAKKKPRVDDGF